MADIDVKKQKETEREASPRRGERAGGMQARGQAGWGLSPRGAFGVSPRDLWASGPFDLMRRMSEEMDRAFQGLWAGGRGEEAWGFAPAIETFEREGQLVVRAELPGVKQEDVKVELSDAVLRIEGERKREHEEEREGYYRSERVYGRFHREIALPTEIGRAEQARAEFKDGVLEVTLPIDESSARRRRIPVQSGPGQSTGTGKKDGR